MTLLTRIRVRWHALVVALCGAMPVLLDQLGVIDLKPILHHFMNDEIAALVVGLMPFYIAFLKPMFRLEEEPKE